MNQLWFFRMALVLSFMIQACTPNLPAPTPSSTAVVPVVPTVTPTQTAIPVSADKPCIGAPAPEQWHHIVVLLFENQRYDDVIGKAPYVTSLAEKCATARQWMDANKKVDGSPDGNYESKPNYASLTSGLPPSLHGLVNNNYAKTTEVDNLYHQLDLAGLSFKDYYEAEAGGCQVHFSGDYHDPIRYYTDVASICDTHDVPLSTFMNDLQSGNLPAFSMIIPLKEHGMYDRETLEPGDAFVKSIVDPILNSPAYANGDLAIFILWIEDSPVPNVLLAPSIVSGTTISVSQGNPISHYSALRTWSEMLGLPLLGDTTSAPSLLPYFNNRGATP